MHIWIFPWITLLFIAVNAYIFTQRLACIMTRNEKRDWIASICSKLLLLRKSSPCKSRNDALLTITKFLKKMVPCFHKKFLLMGLVCLKNENHQYLPQIKTKTNQMKRNISVRVK